jgi:predicted ATPase/DNA-binding SARP family transcriptional activator
MEFRLLGPLEVVDGDEVVEIAGSKRRVVLALLVLRANEVVRSERLIDELWGERAPRNAAAALHNHVSRLRKALGPDVLARRGGGYVLRAPPESIDLRRFEGLLAAAEPLPARGRSAKLAEALALWRGPPLDDLVFEPGLQREIAQLEELRLATLERRVDADLEAGRNAELVAELEALIGEHPLREHLRWQLILSLYRAGRQAEALEVYRETRRVLAEELGLEPSPALRELEKAILNQDPALDLAAAVEPAAEPARSAFVGREAELAELVAGLEEALAGRGRLYLLVGEPGIGKSRLAEELASHARTRGARILVGRCWEAGGAPAYWPWVQSLRAYVREREPDRLRAELGTVAAEVAQLVPELQELFPNLATAPPLEPGGARFRLFDATAMFLRNASASRPILLVLDDLHAADAPSLLLLQFLARELGSTRMLVLGAFRNVDPIPGQPLTEMLAEVAREPVTRRLALGGLSEQDVAAYVELSASEIASPQLAAALHEETEGNPLFVAETVRLLALEGLRPDSTAARIAIPQSVRDVIARRLTHLSEECNRLLVLASVLGREFALAALARLAGVSEDGLLETLDEAMAARILSEVPGAPGDLRFAHVLIRETLYEGLTGARRVRLHRLVVEALEALYGEEPGQHLAELAYHAVAGSDFAKGLRYAQRAGDRALALLAYEEAARLYTRALEALALSDPDEERMRCQLLLSLGEAESASDRPASKKAFYEAADIARRLALPRALAGAAAGYGGREIFARAGADDRLVPLLEEGLVALADEDVELRARLLARLAGALRDEPSRARRDALSSEAVALARRAKNPNALAYAVYGRAAAILAPDTLAECISLGSELCDVAKRIGGTELAVHGHLNRLIAEVMLGDIHEAEADLAAATRIARERGRPVPHSEFKLLVAETMLMLSAGRLSEGEELAARGFVLGERAQPEMAIPAYRLQQYTLCEFRGGLEEVEPAIRDLVAEHPARPVFRTALAHLYARLGMLRDAKRILDDLARDEFASVPFDAEWLYAMSLLAETSALLRDADSARGLYRLLVPWAALNAANHPEGIRGSVSRYLGLVAATLERWDDAAAHFEDALAMNERMGARPWLAYTQEDYGRLLRTRDRPGDRAHAQKLLNDALATYRELGMRT